MGETRFKMVYRLLLPTIAVATCVLGYYTFLTAAQFERLGEKSLAESSLWVAQGPVRRPRENHHRGRQPGVRLDQPGVAGARAHGLEAARRGDLAECARGGRARRAAPRGRRVGARDRARHPA